VILDNRRAGVVCIWLLGLVLGYLMLREFTQLLRQIAESRLGRPSLVRETSRVGSIEAALIKTWRGVRWIAILTFRRRVWRGEGMGRQGSREQVAGFFKDVILAPNIQEQVRSLAVATCNARRNRAPYRHLLLYGPPGTGKTMVAKRLAASSGMDCAIMSGGDVGPLGKDAVTELHGIFRWAKRTSRGLLLFIDEAEAFLGRRSNPTMSEDTRNALNALLFHTGTPSHCFMMVLATNRAE
ncbi:unnamed protein product, partial [Choristocarpus tenellus]